MLGGLAFTIVYMLFTNPTLLYGSNGDKTIREELDDLKARMAVVEQTEATFNNDI